MDGIGPARVLSVLERAVKVLGGHSFVIRRFPLLVVGWYRWRLVFYVYVRLM
jgi:hypothetical protein